MIRKAVVADIKSIQALINQEADKDLMLARSLSELYENIRDFFVYSDKGKVCGCVALHVSWQQLAEIKSLAVSSQLRSKGIASALVLCALKDAVTLGIKEVFVLTYIPRFFKRFGFKQVGKSRLPHKIWTECCHCPKFPDCKEIALLKKL